MIRFFSMVVAAPESIATMPLTFLGRVQSHTDPYMNTVQSMRGDALMFSTDDPMMTTDDPMMTTDDPMFSTDDPMMTTDDPMFSTDDPMMSTDDPMFSTDDPMMTTDVVVPHMKRQLVEMMSTEIPTVSTVSAIMTIANSMLPSEPVVTTETPMLPSEPVVTTETPMLPSEPVVTSQTPMLPSVRPTVGIPSFVRLIEMVPSLPSESSAPRSASNLLRDFITQTRESLASVLSRRLQSNGLFIDPPVILPPSMVFSTTEEVEASVESSPYLEASKDCDHESPDDTTTESPDVTLWNPTTIIDWPFTFQPSPNRRIAIDPPVLAPPIDATISDDA